MKRIYDQNLTNKTFGRLSVLHSMNKKNGDRRTLWKCRCVCGKEKEIGANLLLRGLVRSCGCLQYESRVANCLKHIWKHGKSRSLEGRLLYCARKRAKDAGIPINIDINDIFIPAKCPLLEIPLFGSNSNAKYHPNSPSLDKKVPELGYVKGNVWVISYKANMMKSSATLQEFERVAKNWRAST